MSTLRVLVGSFNGSRVQSFKVVAAVAVPVVQNVQIVPGFKTGSENFHVLRILKREVT